MLKRIILFAILVVIQITVLSEDIAKQNAKPDAYFTCYSGSGHGGSLKLLQFQENADKTYSVLCVSFETGKIMKKIEPRSKWPGDAYKMTMTRAIIDDITFNKAKKICITAIDNVQEDSSNNGKEWISSNDFISGFRLIDGVKPREKIYCGYAGSKKVSFYQPLLTASQELDELSKEFKWNEQDDLELKGFITDTLILLYPNFKDSSWWWPKDRLIRMSGVKGNELAIPLLIKLIKETQNKIYSDIELINARDLGYLVTALDDITEVPTSNIFKKS